MHKNTIETISEVLSNHRTSLFDAEINENKENMANSPNLDKNMAKEEAQSSIFTKSEENRTFTQKSDLVSSFGTDRKVKGPHKENAIFLEQLQSQQETINLLAKANQLLLVSSTPSSRTENNSQTYQDHADSTTPMPTNKQDLAISKSLKSPDYSFYYTPRANPHTFQENIIISNDSERIENDSFVMNKSVSLLVDLIQLYQELIEKMQAAHIQSLQTHIIQEPNSNNEQDTVHFVCNECQGKAPSESKESLENHVSIEKKGVEHAPEKEKDQIYAGRSLSVEDIEARQIHSNIDKEMHFSTKDPSNMISYKMFLTIFSLVILICIYLCVYTFLNIQWISPSAYISNSERAFIPY